MVIKNYLEKKGLSQEQFAQKFVPHVSQGLIWQWISGKTRVTAERAIEIERVTKGGITRAQLRPDLFGARAA